jgi:mannose-1-phosphate guanylyltransferase / mannose-6-phosphate isomerase
VGALEAAKRNESQQHRVVHRPWGSYDSLALAPSFQVKLITVSPGASLSLQLHHKRAEHWIVVEGIARVTINEREFDLSENESTFIPLGAKHRLQNLGEKPLKLIEVQSGSYLGEDDIVRFSDNYGRPTQ